MTPAELRVFHLLIGIFIVVLLVFMVSTVIILKKAEVGTGMSLDAPFYHCNDCGNEFSDEFVNGKLMVFCAHCDPVQYCERTGKPYKSKCDCASCTD